MGQDALTQQVDSLGSLIESEHSDTARIRLLESLAQVTAGKDTKRNEEAHLQIIELCETNLETEVEKADSLFYRKAMAQARLKVGINYFLASNYLKTQEYVQQSLLEFEALGNRERMAMCCVVLGAMHKNQEDLDGALPYMERALELNTEVNDTNGIALTLNNLGTVHLDQGKLDLAQDEFERALNLYEAIGNKRGMGVQLLNLGSAYKRKNDLDQARDYFERSLRIRQEINDLQGLIFSHARLGTVLLEQRQYEAAKRNALESLRLAEEKGYPRATSNAYELLASVYEALGQYKLAYTYHKRYKIAEDSLVAQDNVRALTQAEYQFKYEQELAEDSIRYATEQKALRAELALQEAESQQQRLVTRLLWGGILLALLIGAFVYNRYQQSRRQQRIIAEQKEQVETTAHELSKSNDEKELLLKEIHHRVKNNLQVVSSLLDLQTKNLEDDQALSAIADGQSRVRAMALIHEKLYQNEHIASLNFTDYVRQLTGQLASVYANGNTSRYTVESSLDELDIDTAIPLGLILNELVTNAFKYGVAGLPDGHVAVSIRTLDEGNHLLEVRDNGPGIPEHIDLAKARSLGLRLVRRLSQQLFGKFSYRNEGGAVFSVTFQDTGKRKEID